MQEQTEYEIVSFEEVRNQLQNLNIVKGTELEKESTMFSWINIPDSIHDFPPKMVAVGLYEDKIIGWAGVGVLGNPEGFGHVATYVAPEFRGKGIGTTLIKTIIEKYSQQNHSRNAIVVEMEKDNADQIQKIIEDFGFECLPYVDNKYDYGNDEIWDGKNPHLLGYHKYLTLKVIGCECPYCSK
jgi:GNAT superfamily N-acetyltransferase